MPFYPLGWKLIGACSDDPTAIRWDVVVSDMEAMRRAGMNTLFEPGSSTGVILPQHTERGWWNWKSYRYVDADGRDRQRGHVRTGAYVAALKRYMDLAYFGPDGEAEHPMYVIVSLDRFTVPEGLTRPYDGGESISCEAFVEVMEEERNQQRAADSDLYHRMPAVVCDGPEVLPLWEWNVRYIVQSLRDHPALLAWYLWDEPDGIASRHLFGLWPAGSRPPAYTGPESLPTPDLLRHLYHRIIEFEMEGADSSRVRHPIILDILNPSAFFSNRFAWSQEGGLNPSFASGPFDRLPSGGYHTPADILGLEASATLVQTAALGDHPPYPWYWEPNFLARKAEMLQDVVERDSLWGAMYIAAQGQLTDGRPYGLAETLRCPNPTDQSRLRLLNDRDLVWMTLTPQIDGLRGHMFYGRRYTPDAGPGREQRIRSDRLMRQFREARLDEILRTPHRRGTYSVGRITIETLTNYFRSDPNFVGPADTFEPGQASRSRRFELRGPREYTARTFGRTSQSDAFGEPTAYPPDVGSHLDFELLRTAMHVFEGAYYLFVSNSFDARIVATFDVNISPDSAVLEGLFQLDLYGTFSWHTSPQDVHATPGEDLLRLQMRVEPYEVRILKIMPGGS